jgi:AraC-like DNA-binding protein
LGAGGGNAEAGLPGQFGELGDRTGLPACDQHVDAQGPRSVVGRDAAQDGDGSGGVRGPGAGRSWRKGTSAVTVVVRRPGPPLGGLVRAITYQAGEQPQTSVEKILPGPGASVWINLNRDEFRSFDEFGRVMRVRFAKVQGLQRVVRDLDGCASVDWAGVAARHGYADQPHLVEEFRQLVGVTPTGYLRSRVNGPNHLRIGGFF